MKKTTRNHYRIDIGRRGEDCACQYLKANGLQLIDRNVRTPYGEIDLVMELTGITVFVEVKTRSDKESGYPEDAVTEDKMDHMNECAIWFMDGHNRNDDMWRVDVVAVIGQPNNSIPQLEWFQYEF